MSDDTKIINKTFHHVVLEGTAFEVGQQQGEIIKKHKPESVKWCTSPNVDPKIGFNSFEELQNFFEEYCPGITDELEGFADSLGVNLINYQCMHHQFTNQEIVVTLQFYLLLLIQNTRMSLAVMNSIRTLMISDCVL
ncbi:MAG: hypothetical protein ACTSV2_10185 [Candidatus Thorarchaeota archaeon]